MVKMRGFLCEHRNRMVKVWDCKFRKIVEFQVQDNKNLVVGQFYYIHNNTWKENDPVEVFGNDVSFTVADGAVTTRSWAVRLKRNDIPEEFRDKVRHLIWSPFIGFLRVGSEHLLGMFEENQTRWVTAVYNPKGRDDTFELQSVHEENLNAELERMPWSPKPDRRGQVHPSTLVRMNGFINTQYQVRFGLCIDADVANSAYNKLCDGSYPRTNVFFCLEFGLYRCHRGGRVGHWYDHAISDKRRQLDPYDAKQNRTLYEAVTAVHLKCIPQPLVTMVREGTLKIELGILYDKNDFVDATTNADNQNIKNEVSVWDRYLGRINVPRHLAEWIVETICNYLSFGEEQELTNENILINAIVKLRANYANFKSMYPRQGFFSLHEVQKIKYQKRGLATIWSSDS